MCLNTHIRCVSEISTDERGDKPQPLKILQLIVMIIMASGFVSEQLLMIDAFGIHDQRLIQHHRFIGKRCAINKQSNFGKKQQNRNKRGNRHAQKQQLNDSVYRKDFD